MLHNAPTLAIVAVHTAENEPPKVGDVTRPKSRGSDPSWGRVVLGDSKKRSLLSEELVRLQRDQYSSYMIQHALPKEEYHRWVLAGQAQMIVLSVLKFASFSYANLVRGKLCFFSSFFGLFSKTNSENYCKIHRLPIIIWHLPQFRQNSVKFEAKNDQFAEKLELKLQILRKNQQKLPKILTLFCWNFETLLLESCVALARWRSACLACPRPCVNVPFVTTQM